MRSVLDDRLLPAMLVLGALALTHADSLVSAQSRSKAPEAGSSADAAFFRPAARPDKFGHGRGSRRAAGALLWEDRYDVSSFEQAFSVATLKDLTFAAGYVRNGSRRDFVVRAYGSATGSLVWQDQVDKGHDEFASGVVTDRKRLFVSGTAFTAATQNDWMLRAYDAESGRLLWENMFDLAGRADVSRGTALAAGDGLVFLSGYATNVHDAGDFNTDYIVRAHDAATGTVVWQDRIEGFSGGYAVALEDHRLFVGGWDSRQAPDLAFVRAYDTRSGSLLWQRTTKGASGFGQTWTKAIRVQGGRVFVAQVRRNTTAPFALDPVIEAYDSGTGAVLWTNRFDTGAEEEWLNEIDVTGGRVVAVGQGGPGCGGTVSNCDAIVRSYDAADGTLEWEKQLELSGTDDAAELVTVSGGRVFVLSQAEATYGLPGCCVIGRWVLQAFDSSYGRLLWQSVEGELESGLYNMVVERGRLFIPGRGVDRPTGSWDFIVRAYDVRGRRGAIETLFVAPRNLILRGPSGEISFDITFDGTLTTAASGLTAAEEHLGTVVDDPANDLGTALRNRVGYTIHRISVPAGTRHLRAALFDDETDGADDLDLYVFGAAGNLLDGSANAGSAEVVDIPAPAPGNYLVVVHGFETDGPDANYTLSTWVLGAAAEGNLAVSGPDPSTGPSGRVTLSWSGLVPGRKYLGSVTYLEGVTEIAETMITAIR